MKTIEFSYDKQSFQSKPFGDEIWWINNRIGRSVQKLSRDGLMEMATKIGSMGHTFSPATFKNGKCNKDNFEQQQLFALDFDNKDSKKKLTFEEVKERAGQFEMPILFAYDTMSSIDHDKFNYFKTVEWRTET